jgi:hypothetical protein
MLLESKSGTAGAWLLLGVEGVPSPFLDSGGSGTHVILSLTSYFAEAFCIYANKNVNEILEEGYALIFARFLVLYRCPKLFVSAAG